MSFLNIAGYKFEALDSLAELRRAFRYECEQLCVKGTVLLSAEGINFSLAGTEDAILRFKQYLGKDARFADMYYRESYSTSLPFNQLKVKVKDEIITLRRPGIHPEIKRAPSVSPSQFKEWLDQGVPMTVLDTRNDYEVQFGTFEQAVNLKLNHFSEFPKEAARLSREKKVVMFCTGGIRCEKAALHLEELGFDQVYQLEGGILNYFKEVGGAHFKGDCFVFDQRIALDCDLKETGVKQCVVCQGPMDLLCQQCV